MGIERAFGANAKNAGETYIRFQSPCGKHKTVGSVRSAIIKDAEMSGIDPVQAVAKWEQAVQDEKDAKQKEKDDNGFLEPGEKLDEAIGCFRAKHGALSGAVVC